MKSDKLTEFRSTKPPFSLKLIEEKDMSPAMDQAIRDLLCVCFPPDVAAFSKTRHWHGSAPAYSLVQEENNSRVVGHVGVVVREIRCGSAPLIIAGIQNLAVLPEWRRCGLGPKLMLDSMDAARRRGIPFGLLFCVPALEKFYQSVGWFTVHATAKMVDERGLYQPIPGKNICMAIRLASAPFPPGDIDLQGADW